MRKFFAVAMVIAAIQMILVAQPACGAKRKTASKPVAAKPVAPAIPCYPGGQVDLEITLTQQDILPMIQGLLKNAFVNRGSHSLTLGVEVQATPNPGTAPGGQTTVKPTAPEGSISLEEVFSKVVGVFVLQISVPKSTDSQMLDDYYGRFPKAKTMNRVFFQRIENEETMQLWSGPGGKGLYGFRIFSEDSSPELVKVQVARLDGMIDVSKLLTAENVKALMGEAGVKR